MQAATTPNHNSKSLLPSILKHKRPKTQSAKAHRSKEAAVQHGNGKSAEVQVAAHVATEQRTDGAGRSGVLGLFMARP